jgi:hypothetical protein
MANGEMHAPRRLPPEITPSWLWASIHDWGVPPEYGDLSLDYFYRTVCHAEALWYPSQPTTGTVLPIRIQESSVYVCYSRSRLRRPTGDGNYTSFT